LVSQKKREVKKRSKEGEGNREEKKGSALEFYKEE